MRHDLGLRTNVARMLIAAIVLGGMLLASATPLEADEETRALLRALGVDTPSRPMLVPPLALPDLSGASVRLAELKGQVVMLYFWTTW